MAKPKCPSSNRAREHRIEQEIVVDAYNEEERAIGWHCYLDDKLHFPFKAKCVAVREISPLKKGEEVEVLGMARFPRQECLGLIEAGSRDRRGQPHASAGISPVRK